jgi:hypothetical protein
VESLQGSILEDFLEGALGWRQDNFGLQPLRLADHAMDFCHPALRAPHVAEATNGVRLRFQSESQTLELDLDLVTSDRTAFALRAGATAAPTIDLLIDGVLQARRLLDHDVRHQKLRFDSIAADSESIFEIWLPHNVGLIIHKLSSDSPLYATPDLRSRWVFHGSSITHDALAHGPSETWPALLSRNMGWHLTQLGFRGECHLDPGVARSIASLPANGIILELGINVHNSQSFRQRTLVSAIHGFLQTIRDGHPKTPLIIVSPVFGEKREYETSSLTMDGSIVTGDLTLPIIREALRDCVDTRKHNGDQSVFYINGLELLGAEEAALFPDGLHPNFDGTALMKNRLLAHLSRVNP